MFTRARLQLSLFSLVIACCIALPSSATVTISRSTDPAYAGDDDYLMLQVDGNYSSVSWTASGPGGPIDLTAYTGGYAGIQYPRAGSYSVMAQVALNNGTSESGSMQVTIPKPIALVVLGSPGALTGEGIPGICTLGLWPSRNDHTWCWMQSLGELAATKLAAAGWIVHVIPNASIADLEAAFATYPHIQGLWVNSHGSGQGWIGLARTQGRFTSPPLPFTPTDLASALVLSGQYSVRKMAIMACNQDIGTWKDAIGASEAFSPSKLFGGCMAARTEYNAVSAGHSIFTAEIGPYPLRQPTPPSVRLAETAGGASSCVSNSGPFTDYDFLFDLNTLDMTTDPWAPQACADGVLSAGTPTTVNSPDGLWSITGYAHGPIGSTVPLGAVSSSRIPGMSQISDPDMRFLTVSVSPGGAASLDSMRLTLNWQSGELLDYFNPLSIQMYWIPTGVLPALISLPTTIDIGGRAGAATVFGPGIAVLGINQVAGVGPASPKGPGSRLRLTPNPTRGRVSLGLSLPRPGIVEVEVFTLQGARVVHDLRGALSSGPQQIEVALPGSLAPGIYLVRVAGAGIRSSGKLTLYE